MYPLRGSRIIPDRKLSPRVGRLAHLNLSRLAQSGQSAGQTNQTSDFDEGITTSGALLHNGKLIIPYGLTDQVAFTYRPIR